MKPVKKLWVIILFYFLNSCSVEQKIKSDSKPVDIALYNTIYSNDSLLFKAFNGRDLNTLNTFFDKGLEVIQDNIGIRNYKQTIMSFEELFKKDYILNRKLIKSSLQVYPIKKLWSYTRRKAHILP